jgi:hypothetical protein
MNRLLAAVAWASLVAAVGLAQAQPPAQAPQQPEGGRGATAQAPQPPDGGQRGGRAGRGGARGGGRGRGGAGAAQPMSFFVTSVGTGDGGNLGGLAGADAHCAALAKASGLPTAADRTWRAYLSASAASGQPAVNARDRIGVGPWHNAKGVLVANNAADLHGDIERDRNQLNKVNALTEKGETVNGVGDAPNQHDILTGSDSHGRAVAGTADTTCSNWTSNASPPEGGQAQAGAGRPGANLGHHDRTGGGNTSWNFAHRSGGCSQTDLVATGGAGLFYCFAAN